MNTKHSTLLLKYSLLLCCVLFANTLTAKSTKQVPSKSVHDTIAVYSPSMKRTINAVVAKPQDYTAKSSAEKRYPSIYIIHGFSDNHARWGRSLNLDSVATANDCIIICPDGQNSWYWDAPIDSTMQFETFITRELVPHIDNNYRTIPSPALRAITGQSMGGHGSMFLAMRHPDIFGNAGSMSGGLDIRPFPNNWLMKERLGEKNANLDSWTLHSAINQIDRIKNGDINIIIDCGTKDFFLEVNRNFHKALLDAKIDHDYIERSGGHTWPYWLNAIKYQLLFFRNNFDKAQITQ